MPNLAINPPNASHGSFNQLGLLHVTQNSPADGSVLVVCNSPLQTQGALQSSGGVILFSGSGPTVSQIAIPTGGGTFTIYYDQVLAAFGVVTSVSSAIQYPDSITQWPIAAVITIASTTAITNPMIINLNHPATQMMVRSVFSNAGGNVTFDAKGATQVFVATSTGVSQAITLQNLRMGAVVQIKMRNSGAGAITGTLVFTTPSGVAYSTVGGIFGHTPAAADVNLNTTGISIAAGVTALFVGATSIREDGFTPNAYFAVI